MSNTLLSMIVIPVVLAFALAILAGSSRPWRDLIGERLKGPGDPQPAPESDQPAPASDLRIPELRELEESGTDYVDFGAPERTRRN